MITASHSQTVVFVYDSLLATQARELATTFDLVFGAVDVSFEESKK